MSKQYIKIIQIIPANPRTFIKLDVYRKAKDGSTMKSEHKERVMAWALTEDGGVQIVRALFAADEGDYLELGRDDIERENDETMHFFDEMKFSDKTGNLTVVRTFREIFIEDIYE